MLVCTGMPVLDLQYALSAYGEASVFHLFRFIWSGMDGVCGISVGFALGVLERRVARCCGVYGVRWCSRVLVCRQDGEELRTF